MKYLFSVDNLSTSTSKLYSVEAKCESSAKDIFTAKFLPKIPGIDFETLANNLANIDIIISYLGSENQIENL